MPLMSLEMYYGLDDLNIYVATVAHETCEAPKYMAFSRRSVSSLITITPEINKPHTC